MRGIAFKARSPTIGQVYPYSIIIAKDIEDTAAPFGRVRPALGRPAGRRGRRTHRIDAPLGRRASLRNNTRPFTATTRLWSLGPDHLVSGGCRKTRGSAR